MATHVAGVPVPQGSKKVFNGRVVDVASKSLKEWRFLVASMLQDDGVERIESGPVQVTMMFFLARPRNHYRTTGQLKDWASEFVPTRPDIDKLTRAVLDAATGIAFHDDSQVARLIVTKRYAEEEAVGVSLEIRPL